MTLLPSRDPQSTLSVTDAARVIGVHPNTLRAWSDQGRIRSYRINARGDRRYRRDDLEAFLGSAESAPATILWSDLDRRSAGGDAGAGTGARAAAGPTIGPRAAEAIARIRDELETAAAIAGSEIGASGLDGSLARATRILRSRHGHAFAGIWSVDGDRLVPRATDGRPEPLSVSATGDSLLVRALAAEEAVAEAIDGSCAWLTQVGNTRVVYAAAIPGGSDPWGVLVVADAGERPSHRALLPALATIVGGAVRSARLVDEATRGRRQAEALRRVALELALEHDLDQILSAILEHASALFGADRAAVFLGKPGGHIQGAYARGLSDSFISSVKVFHAWSLPGQAVAERRPVAMTGYFDDPRAEWLRDELLSEGIDTICSAPLFDGAEPLGALNLYHDMPRHWSTEELEMLAAFAAQASVAIRNAQNFKRTEWWAAQLESIQRLGGELSRLSSTSEIGTAIVAEIERLIDFHNVRVYLLEGDELGAIALRGKIGEYDDESPDALRLRIGEGITGWVAKHGIAQYLPDAEADPRTVTIPGTQSIDESMLLAPMIFEGSVLGVIVLSKLGFDRFTDGDLRLLVIFANAAAQALATAEASRRLRDQSAVLERRLRSQRALLQITESLLTTLDARLILEGITERLGELVSYDNVCIELLDARTRTLRPIVARGVDADRYMEPWGPGEEGLATWVVTHGEPQLVIDERADPRIAIFPEQGPVDGSIIAVPLRGPEGVVGVLSVERMGAEHHYDEDDFELVRLFAGQVSIALRNAEHYRAARVQAETDGLTRLLNYASFRERIAQLETVGAAYSLLVIDLDGFRGVNTAYKHQGGNVVLQRVAAAIRTAARESDDVFRYGGDEFVVLLPDTDTAGALGVADRVRRAVAAVEPPMRPGRGPVPRISASIGVAACPDDASAVDVLIDAADRASFYAKREGGDRVATAAEGLRIADEFEPTGPTPVDAYEGDAAEPVAAGAIRL